MKLKKKSLLVGISLMFLLGGSLVACKEKMAATPTETAQITLDFILKGNKDKVSKVGITDADMKKFNEAYDKEFEDAFKNELTKDGVTVKQEQVDKVKNSVKKALTKIEYTVKNEKVTDKTATADIEITPLSIKTILADTEKAYIAKATTNPPKTKEEGMNAFMDVYADEIAKAPLSTKKVTKTLEFKQSKNYWTPTNAEGFLVNVFDMNN